MFVVYFHLILQYEGHTGCIWTQIEEKIGLLFLMHVYDLYYCFSTKDRQLWCGGRAVGREQLNIAETNTKIGNVLVVVE